MSLKKSSSIARGANSKISFVKMAVLLVSPTKDFVMAVTYAEVRDRKLSIKSIEREINTRIEELISIGYAMRFGWIYFLLGTDKTATIRFHDHMGEQLNINHDILYDFIDD